MTLTTRDTMNHRRMYPYLLGAAAVAAVLVLAGVPFAGILPFAVILLCPVMMFFMMKNMGSMNNSNGDHAGHGTHDAAKPDGMPVDERTDHHPR